MSRQSLTAKPIKRQTLAEQVAQSLKESILADNLPGGAPLPTEPELAGQFGVSRAVIRDATRILMAWGLVDVQHGRGVFVTSSQDEAFGEALLLALQREGASVWDVEQFHQAILPEVLALAAEAATAQDLEQIRHLAADYLEIFDRHTRQWWGQEPPPLVLEEIQAAAVRFHEAIFTATHNRLFQKLARPLWRLRNLRYWQDDEDDTPDVAINLETRYYETFVEAIASRDPAQARAIAAQLSLLPVEAIEAMKQTPVGEIPQIPVSLKKTNI